MLTVAASGSLGMTYTEKPVEGRTANGDRPRFRSRPKTGVYAGVTPREPLAATVGVSFPLSRRNR